MSHPILIVEDGPVRSLNISARLKTMGYDVISVSDSSDASLTKAAESDPELVIMDFLHEVETAGSNSEARIKKALNIPLLYVLAKPGEDIQGTHETHLPPSGYLVKKFDDLELRNTIKLAVDKYNSPSAITAQERRLKAQELLDAAKSFNISQDAKANPLTADAVKFLKLIPEFKRLPETSLEQLSERSQFVRVCAGDHIIFEGDQNEASFIVASGRFAMIKRTLSGKELVVELLGPGDSFGLLFAVDEQPAHLSARAQVESEILWIQTAPLIAVLENHPELYKEFADRLALCLHSSHKLSLALAHSSVKVRIAALLVNLVAKFSRIRQAASSPIVIDITRQQIADLTGTTPETATRVTRDMHRGGLINVGSPGVLRIIDLNALKKIALDT